MDTQVINSSDVRSQFGQVIDDALRGRATIVERFGRPAGAFVPMEVYERYLDLIATPGPDASSVASSDGSGQSGP